MPQKRTGNKSLLLSTRVFNELADAAEWVKFHGRQPGIASKPGETTQAWIWALNKTGANLLAGDLVGIGQPTVLPAANAVSFQHQVAHEVVLPNAVTHATRFAVVLKATPAFIDPVIPPAIPPEPDPVNSLFPILVAGVASVQIDVQAGHIGTWAARAKLVTGTVGNLISDPAGSIVVLWCASATAGNTAPTTAGVQKARILVPGQAESTPGTSKGSAVVSLSLSVSATHPIVNQLEFWNNESPGVSTVGLIFDGTNKRLTASRDTTLILSGTAKTGADWLVLSNDEQLQSKWVLKHHQVGGTPVGDAQKLVTWLLLPQGSNGLTTHERLAYACELSTVSLQTGEYLELRHWFESTVAPILPSNQVESYKILFHEV